MSDKYRFTKKELEQLDKFLEQKRELPLKTMDLNDEKSLASLGLKGGVKKSERLLNALKGYQRLVRIVPEEGHGAILQLLGEQINSACQISSMNRDEFKSRFKAIFNENEALIEEVYLNAQKKRGTILLQYMNILQNSEPHIKAARFNQ